MSETQLILHVKGTEQETTTLPRKVVRAAISQGQITHSQLIWSTPDNAWKQVRELPHLLPSQRMAPAPVPRVQTSPLPKVTVAPKGKTVPRAVAKATVRPVESVTASRPVLVRTTGDWKVEDEEGFHPLKWVCIGLGVLVLAVLAGNYLWVNQPLVSQLDQTSYSEVTVYGHLGAFMQPNMIVIHIPATPKLTNANLTSFLVALASSTPAAPLSGNPFERVTLNSGYLGSGHYSLSGYAWKQLGDMKQESDAQRKEFILDQLGNVSGEPLIVDRANVSDDAQQAGRDKIWAAFAAEFIKS